MKYIFPRRFGLHNVFTSTVDARETVQPFKDYTLREQEIAQKGRLMKLKSAGRASVSSAKMEHVPKRLRGRTLELVRKLQKLHSRCSYSELLKHYCPLEVSKILPSRENPPNSLLSIRDLGPVSLVVPREAT